MEDFDDWTSWLLYKGGVGVKGENSWESWWDEEQVYNWEMIYELVIIYMSFHVFFFGFVLNLILACVFLFVRAPSLCSDAKLIPPCSLSFLCWIKGWGEEKYHRCRNISILHVFVFSLLLCLFHAIICILFMQMHIQTLRGRILETILSLRFFLFQYGIVYKLHLTGKDTSLAVH